MTRERQTPSAGYASVLVEGSSVHACPLVLLHGSNGDERDLLGLAGEVLPGATRLSVRGDVALTPGFSFFRRYPDRQVDVDDLESRAFRLARFIESVGERARWAHKPIAIGYSNGAIMAAALLLNAPDSLAGAVLFRPLLPFNPAADADLTGKSVLVVDGIADIRRAPGDGELVRKALAGAGATVQCEIPTSGHALGADDAAHATTWFRRLPSV